VRKLLLKTDIQNHYYFIAQRLRIYKKN